jgi:F0F1-type ATP synthase membrane subunit c/vacuolar-type H+-ATPase subunit K
VALLNDEDQATTLNAFGIPESARVAPFQPVAQTPQSTDRSRTLNVVIVALIVIVLILGVLLAIVIARSRRAVSSR